PRRVRLLLLLPHDDGRDGARDVPRRLLEDATRGLVPASAPAPLLGLPHSLVPRHHQPPGRHLPHQLRRGTLSPLTHPSRRPPTHVCGHITNTCKIRLDLAINLLLLIIDYSIKTSFHELILSNKYLFLSFIFVFVLSSLYFSLS